MKRQRGAGNVPGASPPSKRSSAKQQLVGSKDAAPAPTWGKVTPSSGAHADACAVGTVSAGKAKDYAKPNSLTSNVPAAALPQPRSTSAGTSEKTRPGQHSDKSPLKALAAKWPSDLATDMVLGHAQLAPVSAPSGQKKPHSILTETWPPQGGLKLTPGQPVLFCGVKDDINTVSLGRNHTLVCPKPVMHAAITGGPASESAAPTRHRDNSSAAPIHSGVKSPRASTGVGRTGRKLSTPSLLLSSPSPIASATTQATKPASGTEGCNLCTCAPTMPAKPQGNGGDPLNVLSCNDLHFKPTHSVTLPMMSLQQAHMLMRFIPLLRDRFLTLKIPLSPMILVPLSSPPLPPSPPGIRSPRASPPCYSRRLRQLQPLRGHSGGEPQPGGGQTGGNQTLRASKALLGSEAVAAAVESWEGRPR